jgi:hypothetical protein
VVKWFVPDYPHTWLDHSEPFLFAILSLSIFLNYSFFSYYSSTFFVLRQSPIIKFKLLLNSS